MSLWTPTHLQAISYGILLHSYPYSDDVSLRRWLLKRKGPAVVGCLCTRNSNIVLCERVGLSVCWKRGSENWFTQQVEILRTSGCMLEGSVGRIFRIPTVDYPYRTDWQVAISVIASSQFPRENQTVIVKEYASSMACKHQVRINQRNEVPIKLY